MRENILKSVSEANRAISYLEEPKSLEFIENAAQMIADCLSCGGKVLIAGNGGSLCDAMHFAEELTGFFRKKRRPLAALALSDPGHLTCVSNDLGFEEVFSRMVEALGKEGDVFVSLTTSGNSKNLIRAQLAAQKQGMKTISFLGKTGGAMKGLSDLEWIVEGFPFSDRIQEAHMAAIHILIEMVEKILFETSVEVCSGATS